MKAMTSLLSWAIPSIDHDTTRRRRSDAEILPRRQQSIFATEFASRSLRRRAVRPGCAQRLSSC
jgi:hypothetical protein